MTVKITEAGGKSSTINRFIPGGFRVFNTSSVVISATVSAERSEVQLQGDEQAEDTGMLFLYPIGDNRYCLQLFYLEYPELTDELPVVYSLKYLPDFFAQFPEETLNAGRPFRFDTTTEQQFTVCSKTRALLEQLAQRRNSPPLIKSLELTGVALQLLCRALECITVPFAACQVPACRFLAYEGERDKITAAMRILEQNIDQPQTIKELSRKVAMNECYLKKGFKAITGKTIHEYQQGLRIATARTLLQQQGRSVTDVANILGYSSISHFSTAFKKVTGMKPCELLA